MNHLEDLGRKYPRVAYVCDGVYSTGGATDLPALRALQEKYGLFLYIDDSHGLAIQGERGEGYVRSRLPAPPAHCRSPWHIFVHLDGLSGGEEVPLMTYRTHRRRLLVPLAENYALHFAQERLVAGLVEVFGEGETDDETRRALGADYATIRVVRDGKIGAVSTNRVDDEGLRAAARRAAVSYCASSSGQGRLRNTADGCVRAIAGAPAA